MGWGDPPHEGYGARLLRDGRLVGVWSAETNREATGYMVVTCSCGWRGAGVYLDDSVNGEGQRWWPDLDVEAQDQAMYRDWRGRHMAPMVDPDPASVLVLRFDGTVPRHFLAGGTVPGGTELELRLPDGVWAPVRYEWSGRPGDAPRAALSLANEFGYRSATVSFALPENAELRWPTPAAGRQRRGEPPTSGSRLWLGEDAGGRRHFLDDQPVHAGTGLELRLVGGLWVRVRYEWDWDSQRRPYAYLALGGRGEELGYTPGPVSFPLPERAQLRWPRREGRR